MIVGRQSLLSWRRSFVVLFSLPAVAGAQGRDSTTADSARGTRLTTRVVTATRSTQTLRDVPASVAVLDAAMIHATPAKSVADFMKVIPGFALRDFQSTLVSHPARQAPVLRGLGGSSSSRVLVLLDGVPVNDPFAGWIHWSRIPMSLLSRAEVVRGGGSGVWGDRALSGVINLETAEPRGNDLQLAVSGGTFGTRRTSASGAFRRDKLTVQLAGDLTKTDGYIVVPSAQRGVIDTQAGADDKVAYARVSYHFTPLVSAYVSGNVLDEVRPNATPLRINKTAVQEMRAGMQWITGGGSHLQGTVFGFAQDHSHYFTSEAADRMTETPSLNQFDVPGSALGALVSWSRQVSRHQVTFGGDLMRTAGEVNEDLSWVTSRFTRRRKVDAVQVMGGGFLQDAVDVGRLRLLGSVRLDSRLVRDATRHETDLTNGRVLLDSAFAAVRANRTSYNIGARLRATRDVSLRASVYTAFRSPTMNELFKPFRESGNTIVEANATLASEELLGLDGGLDIDFGRGVVRLTAFTNRLNDGIAELTVATAGTTGRTIAPCGFVPAGGTCRQRRAIDELKSAGLEAEAEFSPSPAWTLRGGYTFNPTEIVRSRLAPALVGKEARGAARHQYSVTGVYRNPRALDLAVTGRYVGDRFDDDLNALVLKRFGVVDVMASRDLLRRAEVFLGIENLLTADYTVTVANNGLQRNGMPRSLEGGLRYRW